MNIFESIRVQGFRRLHDVELKLRPLNVLIGANGSGKTSLLDVFTLLSASAAGELKKTINDIGGIDSNLSVLTGPRGEKSEFMKFELDRQVTNDALSRYAFSLQPRGNGYAISEESFWHHDEDGRIPDYPIVINGISTGQAGPRYAGESDLSRSTGGDIELESFRKALAFSTHYHVLDVSQRSPVRLPQQVREAQLPGGNGEDLVSCLYWIKEADPDRFETIQDTLRVAFPSFDRLNFPPVAAGLLAITWKERDIKHPFFMHQLSEGTLRFLWLVTLLYSPGLTDVTLLDEPEVSLHPELLSVLAVCLREASTRTQLIVATHADRLVRFLQPSEVVTLDMEDGVTTATRAEDLDLEEWLKEYTLDEVWQHGRMGGRP